MPLEDIKKEYERLMGKYKDSDLLKPLSISIQPSLSIQPSPLADLKTEYEKLKTKYNWEEPKMPAEQPAVSYLSEAPMFSYLSQAPKIKTKPTIGESALYALKETGKFAGEIGKGVIDFFMGMGKTLFDIAKTFEPTRAIKISLENLKTPEKIPEKIYEPLTKRIITKGEEAMELAPLISEIASAIQPEKYQPITAEEAKKSNWKYVAGGLSTIVDVAIASKFLEMLYQGLTAPAVKKVPLKVMEPTFGYEVTPEGVAKPKILPGGVYYEYVIEIKPTKPGEISPFFKKEPVSRWFQLFKPGAPKTVIDPETLQSIQIPGEPIPTNTYIQEIFDGTKLTYRAYNISGNAFIESLKKLFNIKATPKKIVSKPIDINFAKDIIPSVAHEVKPTPSAKPPIIPTPPTTITPTPTPKITSEAIKTPIEAVQPEVKPEIPPELKPLAEQAKLVETPEDLKDIIIDSGKAKEIGDALERAGFKNLGEFWNVVKGIKPEIPQGGLSKSEAKPEIKPEAKPEIKPEAKPEIKPEVKSERVNFGERLKALGPLMGYYKNKLAKLRAKGIPYKEAKWQALEAVEKKAKSKPAGEIGKKALGGMITPEDINNYKINWFREIWERFFPSQKIKRLEKTIGREVFEQTPKDIPALTYLFRSFLPARVIFAGNPLASEKVADIITKNLAFEAEKSVLLGRINKQIEKYKLTPEQKEKLADYIEMGLTDEQVEKLPEPYKSVIKDYRKNAEIILELVRRVGGKPEHFRFDITNYLHHFFVGNFEVYSPSQKKRLFIGKYKDAIDFFEKYLSQHPNTDAVIRKREFQWPSTATPLSQKAFIRFLIQVSDALSISTKELMESEILKGVAKIKRKKVFVGALLPRIANLGGYLKDPLVVQKILISKLLRKNYIEEMSKDLRKILPELPPGYRKAMEEYINTIETQGLLDYHYYGLRKITGKIKKWQATFKLGYGLRQAGINSIQFITFSPELGYKNIVQAIKNLKTPEAERILKKSNILTNYAIRYEGGEFKPIKDIKIYHPLGIFTEAEKFTRSVAFLGYYQYALNRFDLNIQNEFRKKYGLEPYASKEDMAIDYAIREVAGSMGMYNYTDLPRAFLHPLGSLAFQFQFIRLVWLDKALRVTLGKPTAGTEIFYKAQPLTTAEKFARLSRFWTMNILLSGLKLIEPLLKIFLGILGGGLGVLLLNYFYNKYSKLATGLFSLIGVDLSSGFSTEPFQVLEKDTLLGNLGVNISDAKKGLTALNKFREGKWKEGVNILSTISPNIARMVEALFFMEEGVKMNWYTEIPQAKFTLAERVAYGLGFTPLRLTKARNLSQFIKILNDEKEARNKQIKEAIKQRDAVKVLYLIKEWNNLFVKMFPMMVERIEEITQKKLNEANKQRLLNRYTYDLKNLATLEKNQLLEELLKRFSIEKQLDIKQLNK